ncbi:MAG: hypothetical protein MN733_22520 [Nitrososphaera sp.]|nr:hypothetical protein [Nitrososphaera sp.]
MKLARVHWVKHDADIGAFSATGSDRDHRHELLSPNTGCVCAAVWLGCSAIWVSDKAIRDLILFDLSIWKIQ